MSNVRKHTQRAISFWSPMACLPGWPDVLSINIGIQLQHKNATTGQKLVIYKHLRQSRRSRYQVFFKKCLFLKDIARKSKSETTTTNHIRQRKQNTDPLRCIYFSTRSSEISSSVNSLFTNKFTHHKWVCTLSTLLIFALAARKHSMLTARVRLRVLNLGQNCQLQIPHTH